MRRTVTLRYPATCAECGAELAKGDRARYYGPYKVYGIGCHARTDPATRPRRPSRMVDHDRERDAAYIAQAKQDAARDDAEDAAWADAPMGDGFRDLHEVTR